MTALSEVDGTPLRIALLQLGLFRVSKLEGAPPS